MPFTESECIAQATEGIFAASELRENLRGDCASREICDRKDQGAGIVRPSLERDCAIRELEVVSLVNDGGGKLGAVKLCLPRLP